MSDNLTYHDRIIGFFLWGRELEAMQVITRWVKEVKLILGKEIHFLADN